MRRLGVFVHFDKFGNVAPHVERSLMAVAEFTDHLVVVSASDLTPTAESTLRSYGQLVRRPNVGYDFGSYRDGLRAVSVPESYDAWLISNDSCVGPLAPLAQIAARPHLSDADIWGITESTESGQHHIQSYFLHVGPRAIAEPVVTAFFRHLPDISDRHTVIRRYELGFSRLALTAGLRLGAAYVPSDSDVTVGAYRAARSKGRVHALRAARAARLGIRPPTFNQTLALGDRALTGAQLPFVKISLLRDDPYRTGADRLLERLERAYPTEFAGVRDYLASIKSTG